MTDNVDGTPVIFVPGQPAILTVDGYIDFDRFRPRAAGEQIIRLPSLRSRPAGRWLLTMHNYRPLDMLPVGAKLMFATFALNDARQPQMDGRTIMFNDVPTGKAISFRAGDGCTLTTEGSGLNIEPPWTCTTLTKTGETSWALAST